jgi:hypothetical protein
MKKAFIFLTSGEAPDLGSFSKGDVRELEPGEVTTHVGRDTLKEIDKLSKDECRRFFFEINVDDLPDSIKVSDMQELLILTKEAIGRGIDLPKKISLDKVKKLLKGEGEEAPEQIEEVTDDVG